MRHETRTAGGTTLAVLYADTQSAEVRERAEELLAEHGAVLVRGLGLTDADAFHGAVTLFGDSLIDSYRGGNTPRAAVSEGVFTSTEYPARFDISLHNEMSYAQAWPSRLFFGCLIAPETGGATPVCDGGALLAALPPEVRERFASGVVYKQHLHGGFGLGKSWQATFETEDKAVVERFLEDSAAEYAWTADGGLRVSQHRPGIRHNPRTGADTWFNQADQWHPSNLPDDEAETLLSLIDDVEDLPHWITYGDGSPLSDDDLAHVRKAQRENKLVEPWQVGDIMIVDNMSVLHGREAYTGDRKIVVSMT
ncbi:MULTISPECIES: TauD/TfdA family dioxygenase [unclassified Streptomyces]|uniref:TauD/TfdA family dioxygenase n=1 Tax=unclassified Streptomyces TaxID=2593676 RepID=UPI001BE83B2D|nr:MULTISPECIES: TauD/TfdA family dioxygenase [unclassified Streptomyces]MBT2405499.1 TauD/TfdA family dioxygenase [Streptomyces sp. ISL-21]MBT2454417.1 TauD/TfdA family dioxygenase [Streptomyces sp. ISL-86]MBT2607822.1 TauD/TfdA family dioxygenase [Streptomyces sp. ISL-87]